MVPTDPDFPFDMPKLDCSLRVPHDWPESDRPTIRVTNPDMPRGFQINVERGFDGLIESALKDQRPITLLGLMNSLDRNLERFLTAEKAQTIKIVVNNSRKVKTPKPVPTKDKAVQKQVPEEKSIRQERIVHVPKKVYTPEQRAEAEKTRQSETRQLEARLNRIPLYKKLSNGQSYIIPITPTKPERLPVHLRAVKSVKLSVPPLYPLEESSVELQTVDAMEARAVDIGFREWVRQGPHTTLMAQVNYLAHNMHLLINTPTTEPKQPEIQAPAVAEDLDNTLTVVDEDQDSISDSDRPHIKFIPRPPEWSMPAGPDGEDSDSPFEDSSDSYEHDSAEESQDGGAPIGETTGSSSVVNAPARGTAVNLPGLELYGIELLEAKMISVTVKCDRCKEHTDIKNIKPMDDPSQPSPVKVESCRKCANSFNVGKFA